ncbi:MAG: radical SAM protein [Candidatus Methanomethylophilaceae archaeon]|nr:radical SAM protein [Candidatus Methanomethylophilaceae archaeon]
MRICEIFRSLQGEGVMIGIPTVFIRTVGCNLSCSWCDTAYSREGGEEMTLEEIVSRIGPTRHICLTGGEPLLQDDAVPLTQMLLDSGRHVTLETNGSMDISGLPDHPSLLVSMDIKCPMSGMEHRMRLENLSSLKEKDQLKFIIADGYDLNYAVNVLRHHEVRCNVVLSPVGGMDLEPLAEEVLASGLEVRVLPQLHKIIWGERKGV